MFPGSWRSLPGCAFIDWPQYSGEASIASLALRVADEANIQDGSVLVGSSLGGIVACEIARIRQVGRLFLVGSAKRKEEVSTVLGLLHPLLRLAPIEFVQRAAAKFPGDFAQMFSQGQAPLIRAMCAAIFDWEGLDESRVKTFRIHGRFDRVIPLPRDADLVLDGGHLIAMSHSRECADFIRENLDGAGTLSRP
jgi:pimeloyl-ACP methyl ester carboxylesterase